MKYIISDTMSSELWGHLFVEDGEIRERMCQFVYDREVRALLDMRIFRDFGWVRPSACERSSLQDNLENANGEVLEDPESWGLRVSDELPDWADAHPAIDPTSGMEI